MASIAPAGHTSGGGHLLREHRYLLACLGLIALGGVFAAQIASLTRFNAHPDEDSHVYTFCYFENHLWLPPLNAPDVFYDAYGLSRVYSRELVYQVYGQGSAPLARLTGAAPAAPCETRYLTYRLFNVALLLITLAVVFAVGSRHSWAAALGVLMLALPQVVYLYSYANSDAWSVSFGTFILLYALTERSPFTSIRRTLLLSLLTGLVLLSKATSWPCLIFAYAVLGWQACLSWRAQGRLPWRILVAHVFATVLAVLLIVAPLKIWYPLAQGPDFAGQVAQISEARAVPELKPSTALSPSLRLRDKGVGFVEILTDITWLGTTGMSFYGLFGIMAVSVPRLLYVAACLILISNGLLTAATLVRRWPILPAALKFSLLGGVGVSAVAVLASMYNSWTVDWQAQGRYLFSILVPMALWLGGVWAWEAAAARAFRLISAGLSLALSFYALWQAVLHNPALV